MSNPKNETITLETQIHFSEEASNDLRSLKRVFQELGLVHQDYINSQDGKDCPYFYGERTLVGFLAAAVWRTGGTALEEYHTNKSHGVGDLAERCDLYITTKQNIGFNCEAKKLWLQLEGDVTKSTEDKHNEAQRNVEALDEKEGLALCFVIPFVNKGTDQKLLRKHIKDWITECKRRKDVNGKPLYDAVVWIGFCEGDERWGTNGHLYSGMLLIVNEVKLGRVQ